MPANKPPDEFYELVFRTMPIAMFRIDTESSADIRSELMALPAELREDFLLARPELLADMARRATIAEANDRAAVLLRAPTAKSLIGTSLTHYWSRRMDSYRRSVTARSSGQYLEEETQVVALDGTIIDVIFAMAPVSHAGRPMTLVGMVDISDRRRAETELAKVQADFAHAARIASLGELTASLAHEVSQPLAAIRLSQEAALRWLEKPATGLEQVRLHVNRIGGHATRAANVIDRVRQMTFASGAARQCCALGSILEDALALVGPQARAAYTNIVVAAHSVRSLILADRIEVEQVIVNLIINALDALKSTEPKSREITVALTESDGVVICTFCDNGPGLTGTAEHRLFDRFFTTKPEGMGLGLAICRTIMEAHNGSITATNRSDGSGTRITLRFPALHTRDALCHAPMGSGEG